MMTADDDIDDRDPLPSYYWELRKDPIHVTSRDGLAGILKDGKIVTNAGGQLPENYPQSHGCIGRKLDAVCLLDFARATPEQARKHDCWEAFFHERGPVAVVLVLKRARLGGYVTQAEARELLGESLYGLGTLYPFVEAWHRGPIDVSAIRECRVYCTVDFRDSRVFTPGRGLLAEVDSAIREFEAAHAEEYRLARMNPFEANYERLDAEGRAELDEFVRRAYKRGNDGGEAAAD